MSLLCTQVKVNKTFTFNKLEYLSKRVSSPLQTLIMYTLYNVCAYKEYKKEKITHNLIVVDQFQISKKVFFLISTDKL